MSFFVTAIYLIKNGYEFKGFLEKNIINATSSVLAKTSTIRSAGGFTVGLNFGEDRESFAFQHRKPDSVYRQPC